MDEVQTTVAAYIAAWNEPDDRIRRDLLEAACADDCDYLDPTQHVSGRAALAEMIGAFQQRHPGHRIILTSRVDHHHGLLRFAWRWLGAHGETVMDGMDFGQLASDGSLSRIVGFFGPFEEPER
jgi:hypothetical protein